ncbi:histidine phosphatase family protein [Actinomycetes bacterium KLBMP 9797]
MAAARRHGDRAGPGRGRLHQRRRPVAGPDRRRARANQLVDAGRAAGWGLVIVFRHAATDQSRPDREPVDLADCATQRNLSDAGRADARAVGAAFRDLGIPVGTVWTSPYCRAKDTTRLAFGRGEEVAGLERLYPDRDQAADQRTSDLIRQHAPAAGQPNLVIAAHGVYPSVLSPPVTLAEGEAGVYSVIGDQVRLLGRCVCAVSSSTSRPVG